MKGLKHTDVIQIAKVLKYQNTSKQSESNFALNRRTAQNGLVDPIMT